MRQCLRNCSCYQSTGVLMHLQLRHPQVVSPPQLEAPRMVSTKIRHEHTARRGVETVRAVMSRCQQYGGGCWRVQAWMSRSSRLLRQKRGGRAL